MSLPFWIKHGAGGVGSVVVHKCARVLKAGAGFVPGLILTWEPWHLQHTAIRLLVAASPNSSHFSTSWFRPLAICFPVNPLSTVAQSDQDPLIP